MRFFHRALNRLSAAAHTGAEPRLERECKARPLPAGTMEDQRALWWAMYTDRPPWADRRVRPLGLPGAIGRELASHALSEFSTQVSGGQRAQYLHRQLQPLLPRLGGELELALCLGGMAFKPCPAGKNLLVETFTTKFTPTRFDAGGRAVAGVFESRPVEHNGGRFVRLEYHDYREDGSLYVVENRAFRAAPGGGLGEQVPLGQVPEWAQLSPRQELQGLPGPLFAYFRPPGANRVDPDSPLGTSVYAGPTAGLIRQADQMWEKLLWEYQSAERKVLMDRSALEHTQARDRLFEFGAFQQPDFFQFLNPEVRDEPFYRGFQRVLQRIEFNTGLAFGTLSDPQCVEKTATEIMAARQRQFVTEKAIQKSLQAALEDLLRAMDGWCSLEALAPAGPWTLECRWGDGVLDDPETRRKNMELGLRMVEAGIMDRLEFRARFLGEDRDQAQKNAPRLPGEQREEETPCAPSTTTTT